MRGGEVTRALSRFLYILHLTTQLWYIIYLRILNQSCTLLCMSVNLLVRAISFERTVGPQDPSESRFCGVSAVAPSWPPNVQSEVASFLPTSISSPLSSRPSITIYPNQKCASPHPRVFRSYYTHVVNYDQIRMRTGTNAPS